MEDKFEKELAALINKHGLEKKLGDTPDYILAKVAINAMVNFAGATKARDDWHGFRNADENKPQEEKNNCPDCCNSCKDRFKCDKFMQTLTIPRLIKRLRMTNDAEEKRAILQFVKTAYKAKFTEMLENELGVRIEIQRIEMPVKKRKFRNKARKDGGE